MIDGKGGALVAGRAAEEDAMSDDDYKAASTGIPWHPGMDRTDYDAGKSVYDQKQALAGPPAPKTEVSGPGFTMIITAPFLAVMYPAMGGLVAAGAGAGGLLVTMLWPSAQGFTALAVALVGGYLMASYGLRAEQALSRFRVDRVVRHVLRLAVPGAFVAQLLMTDFHNSWSMTPVQAFNQATGSAIFAAIVAVVVMHFLFLAFDRRFFPVRDRHAIAQEQKYAGLTEDEIFAIKNAKFRAIRAFALTWLAATAVLIFAVPDAPVVVWAAGAFVVLWLLRGRLFFKLHRQRLAEAAALRERRGDAWTAESPNTQVGADRAS